MIVDQEESGDVALPAKPIHACYGDMISVSLANELKDYDASMKGLYFVALPILVACGHHSTLVQLSESPTANVPYCSQLPPPEPPKLTGVLESLNLNPMQTHALLLEEGASAIVSRGWLTENAAESIDAQYFIFSADNLGLVATDGLLRAAERGVRVRSYSARCGYAVRHAIGRTLGVCELSVRWAMHGSTGQKAPDCDEEQLRERRSRPT